MNITISSSYKFEKEASEVKRQLEKKGFQVSIYQKEEEFFKKNPVIRDDWKQKVMKDHIEHVKKADSILVLNFDKDGKKNYVGGNTLIEMGIAFSENKKIFLLNPIPEISYKDEIEAMKPIILNGDLNLIK